MTTTEFLVIYHDADFDGILSEAVCRHFLQKRGNVTSIGWDYGKPIPDVLSSTWDEIYMVDISIKELMGVDEAKLIWIDHHKTAIDQFNKDLPGYRLDGVAACRLCWQWFIHGGDSDQAGALAATLLHKPDYFERRVAEPLLIRLAGEYDIWDHRDPRGLILQSGLRELDEVEFKNLLIEQFLTLDTILLEQCLTIGVRAKKSRDKANAKTILKLGHTIFWEGITFLCCNGLSGSQAFAEGIRPEHEALMSWRFDGQTHKCTVSLYQVPGHEHLDLSEIAKRYGGGGHKGACGFQISLDQLDFIINEL